MNLVLPSRIPHDALTAYVCDRLRRLTRVLAECGVDTSGGLLGGSDGYGAEYVCEAFAMHPQWWGDCTCGHEKSYDAWLDANPHSATCYATDLDALFDSTASVDSAGFGKTLGRKELEPLCAKHSIPWNDGVGCMAHCTCSRQEREQAWLASNAHDAECKQERPNFKAGDFEVRWYKWIGRSTELRVAPGTIEEIAEVFDRCEAAVRASVVETTGRSLP